jgi:hypothetical protein
LHCGAPENARDHSNKKDVCGQKPEQKIEIGAKALNNYNENNVFHLQFPAE